MAKKTAVPEAPTVLARIVPEGTTADIPLASLSFHHRSYRSDAEADFSLRWFEALRGGLEVPYTPSLLPMADGTFAVVGWLPKA